MLLRKTTLLSILFLSFTISGFAYAPKAKQVKTDTSNFDHNLSAEDNTVQKALDTLDDLPIGGGSGDITAVIAGEGLSGGGESGEVTISAKNSEPLWNAIKLWSRPIETGVPQDGQILKWDASTGQWIYATDEQGGGNGTITGIIAGEGLSGGGSAGTVILSATYNDPIWNAYSLQSRVVSDEQPEDGEVLKWDASLNRWRPLPDESNGSATGDITAVIAGEGLSGGGSKGDVTISANKDDSIWNADRLQGLKVKPNMTPQDGQVLKWNAVTNEWEPADDNIGEGVAASGDITAVIPGTGLLGGGNEGDVTISADNNNPIWNANRIMGYAVSNDVPHNGDLLVWDDLQGAYVPKSINETATAARGPEGSLQFNENGNLQGDASLTWDKVNTMLRLDGVISLKNLNENQIPSAVIDRGLLYVKESTGHLYFKNEEGIEYNISAPPQGIGLPGGENYTVQYNVNGNFEGDSSFTYDPTTKTLTVGRLITTENSGSYIEFAEDVPPDVPGIGFGRLFMEPDNDLHFLNNEGQNINITRPKYKIQEFTPEQAKRIGNSNEVPLLDTSGVVSKLIFDPDKDQSVTYSFIWWPDHPVEYCYVMLYFKTSGTSGHVRWRVRIMAVTPQDNYLDLEGDSTNIDEDDYATITNGRVESVSTTANALIVSPIFISSKDDMQPGDYVRIEISRLGTDSNDDCPATAELVKVAVFSKE